MTTFDIYLYLDNISQENPEFILLLICLLPKHTWGNPVGEAWFLISTTLSIYLLLKRCKFVREVLQERKFDHIQGGMESKNRVVLWFIFLSTRREEISIPKTFTSVLLWEIRFHVLSLIGRSWLKSFSCSYVFSDFEIIWYVFHHVLCSLIKMRRCS